MSVKEAKMNERDQKVLESGDKGQAERLMDSKYKNQNTSNTRK